MRIGIIFPVVIFITAVVFLAWFFIGGYAAREHKDEKKQRLL
ncbi:YoaK family small membrane protein [Escherichia coli]